jgi:hypothetical protein
MMKRLNLRLRAFAFDQERPVDWACSRVREPVADLLATTGAMAWDRHYRDQRHGLDDPVFRYGQSALQPIAIDMIPLDSPRAATIAAEREAHGLKNGMVIPIITGQRGSFATAFNLADEVLRDPIGSNVAEVSALFHWMTEFGDWSGARRAHLSGERLPPAESQTCRDILSGLSPEAVAKRQGAKTRAIYRHLKATSGRLINLGLWVEGTKPRQVPDMALKFGLFDPCDIE